MKSKFKNIISGFAVGVMILSNVFSPIATAYNSGDAHTQFVMPDHNVVLRATSRANTYTIVFHANGGTGTMSSMNMQYGSGKNLTSNSFTRTGYTFRGWSTGATINTLAYQDGAHVSNLATTGTVDLYALWSANKYYVSFSGNQGSDTLNPVVGMMPTQTFTYNQTQQLTGNKYVRTGYTFSGWSLTSQGGVKYVDEDTGYNMTTESGDTVTLYAVWTANTGVKYTVNYYTQNLSGTGWTEQTVELSGRTYDVVTAPTKTYEGFRLSGDVQTGHIKGDETTVFNYYYLRNEYTVTLHKGKGVASVSGSGTYAYDAEVNVSAELKPGYTGLNWTGDKTTSTFNMPATGVDMTASATPITYSINLNVGSGTISGGPTGYNVEQTVNIPNPTRTGYDFVEWTGNDASKLTGFTATGCQLKAGTIGTLELEAVWSPKAVTYTVYHMHENLSGEYEQIGSAEIYTGMADSPFELSGLNHDILQGDCVTYTGGSLTMSTGSLPSLVTTTTVLPDGSREVYLYYTRNNYTVTLEKDEGIDTIWFLGFTPSSNTITKTYKCGAEVDITAEPKEGYKFNNWTVIDGLSPTS